MDVPQGLEDSDLIRRAVEDELVVEQRDTDPLQTRSHRELIPGLPGSARGVHAERLRSMR